jgi:hypothetical protein
MNDEDLVGLIKAVLERLPSSRFGEVIDAVYAKRREKEDEVKNALVTEFRERAMQMGLSFDTLFGKRRSRADSGQPGSSGG